MDVIDEVEEIAVKLKENRYSGDKEHGYSGGYELSKTPVCYWLSFPGWYAFKGSNFWECIARAKVKLEEVHNEHQPSRTVGSGTSVNGLLK